jgi:predicted nuclease of predicted toxin-antitoxin system
VARILGDENVSYTVLNRLRSLGHDIVSAREEGLSSLSDDQVYAHALVTGLCILTHDRVDYKRLHFRRTCPHFGIIICSQFEDAGVLDDQLIRVVRGS